MFMGPLFWVLIATCQDAELFGQPPVRDPISLAPQPCYSHLFGFGLGCLLALGAEIKAAARRLYSVAKILAVLRPVARGLAAEGGVLQSRYPPGRFARRNLLHPMDYRPG